ncbi:MAG: desulfoferrodoxin FeS4 iron-binding domain-containing protein [Candidatus Gastranaerophilales bacterium]|nr:desulfoferrodoxin FeS4 iron-binding domain-containing protein [Candidatus Gastranaerophilales bacterium]
MSELMQLYKCNVCGNIIEIINPGAGQLVCCSVPMELLPEKYEDEEMIQEKHVPIIIMQGQDKLIRIGSIIHPMLKEHYIMFIEAISPDKRYLKRKYLTPGEEPNMELKNNCSYDSFTARELCNIHGLWTNAAKQENPI